MASELWVGLCRFLMRDQESTQEVAACFSPLSCSLHASSLMQFFGAIRAIVMALL